MTADLLPFGPWMLIQLVIALIGVITIGRLVIILLGIVQDLIAAVIETVLTPIHVIRRAFNAGRDGAADNAANRAPHQDRDGDGNAVVADGGAHEPPPNVLWPPENAFQEDEP